MEPPVTHVVWDWNGTLLADFEVVVEANNAVLLEHGLAVIGRPGFRNLFAWPLTDFQARLFGRELSEDESRYANDRYFHHYLSRVAGCPLALGALAALEAISAAGLSQSLLSGWRHDSLASLVETYGLSRFFVRVEGMDPRTTRGKREALPEHLEAIGCPARNTLLIGDTIDDFKAAMSAGARCVLVAEHSPHNLSDLVAATPETFLTLEVAVSAIGHYGRSG
jgi:phosphoglycolate phosphatase-like HAD superfamily hydrolase